MEYSEINSLSSCERKTMRIQVSWLLMKPADLYLHCFLFEVKSFEKLTDSAFIRLNTVLMESYTVEKKEKEILKQVMNTVHVYYVKYGISTLCMWYHITSSLHIISLSQNKKKLKTTPSNVLPFMNFQISSVYCV